MDHSSARHSAPGSTYRITPPRICFCGKTVLKPGVTCPRNCESDEAKALRRAERRTAIIDRAARNDEAARQARIADKRGVIGG
jgi:hypothetical protein